MKTTALFATMAVAVSAMGFTTIAEAGKYRQHRSHDGKVTVQVIVKDGYRSAGWQRPHLRPRGIRRSLRNRGFRHIQFVDRSLPVYKVFACKRGKLFKLKVNRWGEIMRRKRKGWCGAPRYGKGMRHGGYPYSGYYDQGPGIYLGKRGVGSIYLKF